MYFCKEISSPPPPRFHEVYFYSMAKPTDVVGGWWSGGCHSSRLTLKKDSHSSFYQLCIFLPDTYTSRSWKWGIAIGVSGNSARTETIRCQTKWGLATFKFSVFFAFPSLEPDSWSVGEAEGNLPPSLLGVGGGGEDGLRVQQQSSLVLLKNANFKRDFQLVWPLENFSFQ